MAEVLRKYGRIISIYFLEKQRLMIMNVIYHKKIKKLSRTIFFLKFFYLLSYPKWCNDEKTYTAIFRVKNRAFFLS